MNIVVLGVGGHGWRALDDFIETTNHQITALALTVDYGGSQGIWYRLLEYNQAELMLELYAEKRPVVPWGDFNKAISYFLTRSKGHFVGGALDFRSDVLQDHLDNFEILADQLALEKSVQDHFIDFFSTGFNYYLENKDKLEFETSKKFCFGYPWQDYVYWNLGAVADVNKFYHTSRILPENFYLQFIDNQRHVLHGIDVSENELVGEEVIDDWQKPVKPESLVLKDVLGNKAKPSKETLKRISKADIIIIPAGSIANWLPLMNEKEILEILKTKKIIWVLNMKIQPNENPINNYIDYLKSLGLEAYLLGPKDTKQKPKNQKFNDFKVIQESYPHFINSLEIVEIYKYNSKSVTESLSQLLDKETS